MPCGACDVCAPESAVAQVFRAPSAAEEVAASRVVLALRERNGASVGQLHRDLAESSGLDRRAFEHVLGSLARAGVVRLVQDSFVKDGITITFSRAWLVGDAARVAIASIRIVDIPISPFGDHEARSAKGTRSATRGKRGKRVKRGKRGKRETRADAFSKTKRSAGAKSARGSLSPNAEGTPLEGALRAWRTSEAKRRRVPAFRILTDRTLTGIAEARPTTEAELLAIAGMGQALLEKHGATLLSLVARAST
jgi:DNA topoisomerase-3